ncbi:hypothetical protein LOK49_LG06G02488 [Camellia lanceoleosa]|uniref:Uncharacterized protein n=1 Tax=Camellia lanceoleosa TaxID=1840588 RepID=A0ACC0HDQ9_9ERIC|nr:hypothetical protein LOK49_LG06G02488 [Camellia lanceoleosa]
MAGMTVKCITIRVQRLESDLGGLLWLLRLLTDLGGTPLLLFELASTMSSRLLFGRMNVRLYLYPSKLSPGQTPPSYRWGTSSEYGDDAVRRGVDGIVYTPGFIRSLSGSEGNKAGIQIEVDLNRAQPTGGHGGPAQRDVGLSQIGCSTSQPHIEFTGRISTNLRQTRKELLKEKALVSALAVLILVVVWSVVWICYTAGDCLDSVTMLSALYDALYALYELVVGLYVCCWLVFVGCVMMLCGFCGAHAVWFILPWCSLWCSCSEVEGLLWLFGWLLGRLECVSLEKFAAQDPKFADILLLD